MCLNRVKWFMTHRSGDWNRNCTLTFPRTVLYEENIWGADNVYYKVTLIIKPENQALLSHLMFSE